jgi:hypothetical protein
MYFDIHPTQLPHSPDYLSPSTQSTSLLLIISPHPTRRQSIYYGTEVVSVAGTTHHPVDSRIGARRVMVVWPRLMIHIEIEGLHQSKAHLGL